MNIDKNKNQLLSKVLYDNKAGDDDEDGDDDEEVPDNNNDEQVGNDGLQDKHHSRVPAKHKTKHELTDRKSVV